MADLFIAPHADVRVVVEDLGKMSAGLAALGLESRALTVAIRMLTMQSIEIAKLRAPKEPADG